jgi:hypothetical protein
MNINFKQYGSERLYPLGFKFTLRRGKKDPMQTTIIDYAITHNSRGEVVNFNYICEYDFCGQKMKTDFVQATIDMATNNAWQDLKI